MQNFPMSFNTNPTSNNAFMPWTSTMFASLGSGTRPDLTPQLLPLLSEPRALLETDGAEILRQSFTETVHGPNNRQSIRTTAQFTCPCTQTLHVRISILPASPNDTYLQRHGYGCLFLLLFCFLSFPLSLSSSSDLLFVLACLLAARSRSRHFSSQSIYPNLAQPNGRPVDAPNGP